MVSTSPPAQERPPPTADDCIPTKKRRMCDVPQPAQIHDRISALPDDILIKILSLMTVREAAVTDCLSTRWRNLWGNVNHLKLNRHTFGMQVPANSDSNENPDFWNSEATKFVNKVNGVLRHHSGNGIKKFTVHFALSSAHASELDRWVAFAAASGSENIRFILHTRHSMVATPPAERYNFPLKHFADLRGCRLRTLVLTMCSIETEPANLSGFSCLGALVLHDVSVVDSVLLNIMYCCRALRRLVLHKCHQLINVIASHGQLVFLEVYSCKSVISISIHAEKLECFSYKGRNIDIEYERVPVVRDLCALFVKNNECPLDFIVGLPKLRTLILQFPSCLQVSQVLQHSERFACLKEITLRLMTSWNERICSVSYLLKAAPRVETLNLDLGACGYLQPPSELKIIWPKKCTLKRLCTVRIRGFSGEPELMELLFFLLRRSRVLKTLLIDTHQRKYFGYNYWEREESEDATRCHYAREVAWTHLAPKIPSTVKFSVI